MLGAGDSNPNAAGTRGQAHTFQIKCEQKGKQADALTRCDASGIVPSAKLLLLCERNGAA